MTWKIHGEGKSVKEVWEDFYGNLWFVTEQIDKETCFGYVRLYNMPDMAEWGSFRISDIKKAIGEPMVWRVSKKNWGNIDTYEKGLLMEC